MKVVRVPFDKDVKCKGCNWKTNQVYKLEDQIDEAGLCGECFINTLIDSDFEVYKRPSRE